MNEKIALVTGANAGIGKALSAELARRGMHVVMVARDQQRGEAARNEVMQQSGSQRVDLLIADLASMQQVRDLAAAFKQRYPTLDVLVNNAAVHKGTRTVTPDGLETTFATNHLAPFLLTHLLLDRLKASASPRVLNITAPSTSKLNFDDLQGETKFSGLDAFGASKMANLLFTFAAARRPEFEGIAINAIHPGLVKSGILKEANPVMRFMISLMSAPPEKAVASIADVATSPDYASETGRFYHRGKEMNAAEYAHDQQVQDRLWKLSAELVGLPVMA
jgi:NAD(P)-dependent dehydrogenase (short-subunit alcohol dehydrogenase family)